MTRTEAVAVVRRNLYWRYYLPHMPWIEGLYHAAKFNLKRGMGKDAVLCLKAAIVLKESGRKK